MKTLRRAPLFTTLLLGSAFGALFMYATIVPRAEGVAGVLDPARFTAAEEERLRARLRDPESARFRDEFVSTIRPLLIVCGELNQKNATGGYAGFERFIAGPEFELLEGAAGAAVMDEVWTALCRRAP